MIAHELVDENSHLFRQYTIQGTAEPRAHFLLHEKATYEDFEMSEQPGYRYGAITMKARPLELLPAVQKLSENMLKVCNVNSWNAGVNPVFYRDHKDYIGPHADDDQEEDTIMTILVQSPEMPRRVVIESSDAEATYHQEGDVQYELHLGAGDAYVMDGAMQQHYKHGVTIDVPGNDERIALVLRHGKQVNFRNDSGVSLEGNISPRVVVPMSFGPVEGLVEGDSYGRRKLKELGAHRYVRLCRTRYDCKMFFTVLT